MRLSRPRFTVRRMMIEVACLGLGLAGTRFVLRELPFGGSLGTVYSKDYDETKFGSLRVGMSAKEIESIMGHPLMKEQFARDDLELWYYSDQTNAVSSFWRRWVCFRQGKATEIINDYWID
jgi:SmpA / OmlA family